jgi:hypothetical protein
VERGARSRRRWAVLVCAQTSIAGSAHSADENRPSWVTILGAERGTSWERNTPKQVEHRRQINEGNWRSSLAAEQSVVPAQVGRLAYEDAMRQWKLATPDPVKLSKCEPWPAGADGAGNELGQLHLVRPR